MLGETFVNKGYPNAFSERRRLQKVRLQKVRLEKVRLEKVCLKKVYLKKVRFEKVPPFRNFWAVTAAVQA